MSNVYERAYKKALTYYSDKANKSVNPSEFSEHSNNLNILLEILDIENKKEPDNGKGNKNKSI